MIEYENLNKLNYPFFERYTESFKAFLNKGWFILGDQVNLFENEFSKYNNSEYCIGVANGLDALTIALKSFNFKKGSEVIVPSNTYIATILSILNCNLIPILVEPDLDTYNINPKEIEKSITKNTVAIMVVHLYGKCCDMDSIIEISKIYKLTVIEDCAQSHGAMFKGKKAGTFGAFGAFSFYPTKNLGALGDAGCLITNDENLYTLVKKIRNYGSNIKYFNEIIGVNSRLDELQATFLRIKLEYLDKINSHKRFLANLYIANLKDDFIKPVTDVNYYDVYHIFNVRHKYRDKLKKYLLKNGVQTEIHYPLPPHSQQALKGKVNNKKFPISEEIHQTTLSLPVSFIHSEQEIYDVIELMNKF